MENADRKIVFCLPFYVRRIKLAENEKCFTRQKKTFHFMHANEFSNGIGQTRGLGYSNIYMTYI